MFARVRSGLPAAVKVQDVMTVQELMERLPDGLIDRSAELLGLDEKISIMEAPEKAKHLNVVLERLREVLLDTGRGAAAVGSFDPLHDPIARTSQESLRGLFHALKPHLRGYSRYARELLGVRAPTAVSWDEHMYLIFDDKEGALVEEIVENLRKQGVAGVGGYALEGTEDREASEGNLAKDPASYSQRSREKEAEHGEQGSSIQPTPRPTDSEMVLSTARSDPIDPNKLQQPQPGGSQPGSQPGSQKGTPRGKSKGKGKKGGSKPGSREASRPTTPQPSEPGEPPVVPPAEEAGPSASVAPPESPQPPPPAPEDDATPTADAGGESGATVKTKKKAKKKAKKAGSDQGSEGAPSEPDTGAAAVPKAPKADADASPVLGSSVDPEQPGPPPPPPASDEAESGVKPGGPKAKAKKAKGAKKAAGAAPPEDSAPMSPPEPLPAVDEPLPPVPEVSEPPDSLLNTLASNRASEGIPDVDQTIALNVSKQFALDVVVKAVKNEGVVVPAASAPPPPGVGVKAGAKAKGAKAKGKMKSAAGGPVPGLGVLDQIKEVAENVEEQGEAATAGVKKAAGEQADSAAAVSKKAAGQIVEGAVEEVEGEILEKAEKAEEEVVAKAKPKAKKFAKKAAAKAAPSETDEGAARSTADEAGAPAAPPTEAPPPPEVSPGASPGDEELPQSPEDQAPPEPPVAKAKAKGKAKAAKAKAVAEAVSEAPTSPASEKEQEIKSVLENNPQIWLELSKSLPTKDGDTLIREKLFDDMDTDGNKSLDLQELHERFLAACGFGDKLPRESVETRRMLELAYEDGKTQDKRGADRFDGITADTFVHFLYYVGDFSQLFSLFCAGKEGAFKIEDRDHITFEVFRSCMPSLRTWGDTNLAFRNYVEDKEIFSKRCETLFKELCRRYNTDENMKTITFPDFSDWAIRKAAEIGPNDLENNPRDWLRLAKQLPTQDGMTPRRKELFSSMDLDGNGGLDLEELHERFIRACKFDDTLPVESVETKRLLELAYNDGIQQDPANSEDGINVNTFVHFLYYIVDFAALFSLFSGAAKQKEGTPKYIIEDRDHIDLEVFKQTLSSLMSWAADNYAFKNLIQEKIDKGSVDVLFKELCGKYAGGRSEITFPDLTDWAITTAAEMEIASAMASPKAPPADSKAVSKAPAESKAEGEAPGGEGDGDAAVAKPKGKAKAGKAKPKAKKAAPKAEAEGEGGEEE